jgi:TDG/mug DNA glycosylase family protein
LRTQKFSISTKNMNRQDARREGSGISKGFQPIAREDARVLVLGSLPSKASIRAREYYAHPRNAFWKIMRVIAGASGDYASRCRALEECGIAVWDVLNSSVRPGSLDADIEMASAVPNDFEGFFTRHGQVRLVCFNGRKAQDMFCRFVRPELSHQHFAYALLPSTSPAHASLTLAGKADAWRGIIAPQLLHGQQ